MNKKTLLALIALFCVFVPVVAMRLIAERMSKLPGRKSMIVFSDSLLIREDEELA